MADDSGLTMKELLVEVRQEVRAMRGELGAKADRQAVEALSHRVDGQGVQIGQVNDHLRSEVARLERRIDTAESDIRTQEAVGKGKAALLSLLIALIVAIVAVAGLLLKIGAGG